MAVVWRGRCSLCGWRAVFRHKPANPICLHCHEAYLECEPEDWN